MSYHMGNGIDNLHQIDVHIYKLSADVDCEIKSHKDKRDMETNGNFLFYTKMRHHKKRNTTPGVQRAVTETISNFHVVVISGPSEQMPLSTFIYLLGSATG